MTRRRVTKNQTSHTASGSAASSISYVLVVDDKARPREAIKKSLNKEVGDRYEVKAVKSAKTALKAISKLKPEKIPIVAVDLALAGEDVAVGLQLVREIRKRLPDSRIIAYTLLGHAELAEQVRKAGGNRFVWADRKLEHVVMQLFLEKELHELRMTSPLVGWVFNNMHIGISVQDTEMNILWMNAETARTTDAHCDSERHPCWQCYHQYEHREIPCAGCISKIALDKARAAIEKGGAFRNEDLVASGDPVFVPIRGEIEPVRVRAAAILNSDRTQVLAIVEASEFVRDQWQKTGSAYSRFLEVMEAARAMTHHRWDSGACPYLAVYYRPDKHDDFFLFGPPTLGKHVRLRVPTVLRNAEMSPEYLGILTSGQPAIVRDPSTDSYFHYLHPGKTANGKRTLLIDVLLHKSKPLELFTKDLRPFWKYLLAHFDEAYDAREDAYASKGRIQIQKFISHSDKADQGNNEAEILTQAIQCMNAAMIGNDVETTSTFSVYLRLLNRARNALIKSEIGLGDFRHMRPLERSLRYEEASMDSAYAASHRERMWTGQVEFGALLRGMGHQPNEREIAEISAIAGYCTLPLINGSRMLGTLNVQFHDDSALSPARINFFNAMAAALSNALGRIVAAEWNRTWIMNFNALDDLMVGSSSQGGLDAAQEDKLFRRVTEMVFDLTYAACVIYYRRDAATGNLLSAVATKAHALRDTLHFPNIIPEGLGAIGMAARGEANIIPDYEVDDWRSIKEAILAAYPPGPERDAVAWVRCEVAVPVKVNSQVVGVLAAVSALPGWLSEADAKTVKQVAEKVSHTLSATRAERYLDWEHRKIESLSAVTVGMGRASDLAALQRMLLLGVTSGYCLEFSRAILFEASVDGKRFTAKQAIGTLSKGDAEKRWREAVGLSLNDQMAACLETRRPDRADDLFAAVSEFVLSLDSEPELEAMINSGRFLVKRALEPHRLRNSEFIRIITTGTAPNTEYVFCPLHAGDNVVGAVWADRAFLPQPEVDPTTVRLLDVLCTEGSLIMLANDQRSKLQQEVTIRQGIAWGVSYALRSRAAALEARLSLLKRDLGDAHAESLKKMQLSVEFFKRAGTLTSKLLQLGQIEIKIGQIPPIDVCAVTRETTEIFGDHRIVLDLERRSLMSRIERGHLEDLLVEILLNARDFADRVNGRIDVSTKEEDGRIVITIADNGPGVHPQMRPHLFQMFSRYPASRMGLGLTYARTLARAYMGDITEISEFGGGAHFVITLPAEKENTHAGEK